MELGKACWAPRWGELESRADRGEQEWAHVFAFGMLLGLADGNVKQVWIGGRAHL